MLALVERVALGIVVAVVIAVGAHSLIAATLGRSDSNRPLEVLREPRPSFTDEARRALLLAPRLAEADRPLLLVVGASNGQEGFQPSDISVLSHQYASSNLSIAAANMTEIEQVVRFAIRWTQPKVLSRSVLVLPVTYSMFSKDSVRWFNRRFVPASDIAAGTPRTDIDRAIGRCILLAQLHQLGASQIPDWIERLLAAHYRDYLLLSDRFPLGITQGGLPLQRLWSVDLARILGGRPRPDRVPTDQLAFIADFYFAGARQGIVYDEQFAKLREIITLARASGMRTVVVNMPLTTWHLTGMPAASEFDTYLQGRMSAPDMVSSTQFLDLERTAGDDEFSDSVHPKAAMRIEWSRRLVSWLESQPKPPEGRVSHVPDASGPQGIFGTLTHK